MNGGYVFEDWQIRLILPHRPPMLQLDRVTDCATTLDRLHATKALGGADSMMLRGVSGSATLAPGAVIEALAQCCGLLLRLRWLAHHGADLAAFTAGDSSQVLAHDIPKSVLAESDARFGGRFASGQILRLTTRLVLSRGTMHRFEGLAQAGAEDGRHGAETTRHGTETASVRIMLNFPVLAIPSADLSHSTSKAEATC